VTYYHDVARAPADPAAAVDHGFDDVSRGISGWLLLDYTTLRGKFVSPGTGRLVLRGSEGSEVPAAEAARSLGRPVLPGTGIKGAVRTVFEVLTGSCDPTRRGCNSCAACRLFGALGRRGRLGFDDAVGQEVTEGAERVPIPFKPRKPADGIRLYDLGPALLQTGARVEEKLVREVFRGTFRGRMAFHHATPGELGLVLLALGWDGGGVPFPLRLGGVRFHGEGAASVSVAGAFLAGESLHRERLEAADAQTRATEWAHEAHERLGPKARAVLAEVARVVQERRS